MTISLVFHAFSGLASPVAVNRLLKYGFHLGRDLVYSLHQFNLDSYIETGGAGAFVRPWCVMEAKGF